MSVLDCITVVLAVHHAGCLEALEEHVGQRRPIDPSKAIRSLRPFWWKDVPCPIPSFIPSRYTVVSQNSILLCHFQCL